MGTLRAAAGLAALSGGTGAYDASYEGSMAFPVAPRAYARLRFVLDQPPSDSAGTAGKYLVNGQISPSAWEHGQVFWAFSGARLLGRLQPRKVLVGVHDSVVHGRVHDYFKQPVPGARLTLERRSKSGWSPVKTSKANRRGRFLLAPGTRVGCRAHQLVFVHAVPRNEHDPLALEEPRDCAGRAEAAVVLGEDVADVRRRAVPVVRQGLHEDGHAVRPVSLIGDRL